LNKVSIISTDDYIPHLLDSAVESHFQLLGLDSFLRPGLRVTLKPNLLMKRTPEEATTTHPEVVAAVVRALKKRGVTDITLADSPGGLYTVGALSGIYKTCGMTDMAQREEIQLNLDTGWREITTQTHRVTSFNIINPVAQADLMINICKLKTHCMTGLSGAVKNLFGCVPGLQKPEFHYRFKDGAEFSDMLIDLCETVKPAITFVDAVVSMEGDGPSGGTPIHTGLTLCAANPYSLDVVLCRLIHMPNEQAYTVKASFERGLASAYEAIELVGDTQKIDSIQSFRLPATKPVDFNTRLPKWIQGAVNAVTDRWLVPKPVIHLKQCIGCGKCAESCPAKTIAITDGKAYIDYGNCIKCYCCHEMCPVKAIHVKRSRLFRS